MNIREKLAENLYSAFFALCAVLLLEGALLRLADVSVPIAVGITTVIFLTATVFVYINRKNAAVYIGFIAIIALIFWALNSLGVPIAEYSALTAEHFFSGVKLETGELILLTSVISLLLSALLFPLSKILIIRLFFGASMLGLMIFYGVNGIVIDPTESFAAAGMVISVIAEISLSIFYRKEPRKKLRGVMSFLFPLFMALSVAVAVIPSSSSAISWRLVRSIASAIAETVEGIAADISLWLNPTLSEFSIGMQGYSDSGDVGGDLSENTAYQLGVTENSRLRSSVYLIGSISDIYERDGWKKSEYRGQSEDDYYLDYCETMLAFERAGYTREELQTFTARTGLAVSYKDILTKTVFYPLKCSTIALQKPFDALSPNIMLNGRAEQGSVYAVHYLEINYRSAELGELLRTPFSYSAEDVTQRRELDKQVPNNVEEVLSERADYIKTAYTALPDFVTERTRELAAEITEGCTDDYSKLLAIEAFLRHYTYTLSPGNITPGYDAVDYFLFESGEGYCTYFASAMAVLARCVGIPTRYVQGFAIESSEMTLHEEYSVPASAAHAWAEGYIEGFGWVPFEPTAPKAESRYGFEGIVYTDESWLNYDYDYLNDNEPSEETKEDEEKDESSLYIIIVCLAIGGTAIIILCYLMLKIRAFLKHYKAAGDTEKFLTCYGLILKLLSKSKLSRGCGETADRFAKRVCEAFPDDELSFKEITDSFDKIRYGDTSAGLDERQIIEEYLRALLSRHRKKGKLAGLAVLIGFSLGNKN